MTWLTMCPSVMIFEAHTHQLSLIHLLNSGPASWSRATIWHATLWHATTALVHLDDDRIANSLQVLLHGLKLVLLCVFCSIEPCHDLIHLTLYLGGRVFTHSRFELVLRDGILHLVTVRLQAIFSVNALFCCLILLGILLSLTDHAVNVVL